MLIENEMKIFHWSAILLLILGGVNSGLVALANFNLIDAITAYMPIHHLSRVVYGLIGISAIYLLVNVKKFA